MYIYIYICYIYIYIYIYILSNISQSKSNHTIKFGQLIEYNKRFSFKNHAENEAGTLLPDIFLFLNLPLYDVKKQVVYSLVYIYFDSPRFSTQ